MYKVGDQVRVLDTSSYSFSGKVVTIVSVLVEDGPESFYEVDVPGRPYLNVLIDILDDGEGKGWSIFDFELEPAE